MCLVPTGRSTAVTSEVSAIVLSSDDLAVFVRSNVVEAMLASCGEAGRRETGGILIGRYDDTGTRAEVYEATPKPSGSTSGWFSFRRGNRGLRKLLLDRWAKGFHYLGEWHYHPGGAPEPSGSDYRAMEKIARDDAYRCQHPLMLILGGDPVGRWSLSGTICSRSMRPVRLCTI